MDAIITGDIVNSSKVPAAMWLAALNNELATMGHTPGDWQIYRGDSFQLLAPNAEEALFLAIRLKAVLKGIRQLDVRMAIGIGDINFRSPQITASNGSAFLFSGEKFDKLKQEDTRLAVKSSNKDFDEDINLLLRLALTIMDNWTINEAEIVHLKMLRSDLSQTELGKIINLKQNTISDRLKRAGYKDIMAVDNAFRKKLNQFL